MTRIIAVCKTKQKGAKKKIIAEGILRENHGLIDDAHADSGTYRQVSLLATESSDRMRQLGLNVGPGDFAGNLTCEGIDLASLPVGTQVSIGKEVMLEITQIGKGCHSGCAIFRQTGKCIMPKEGVFATVVKEGLVKAEDTIRILAGSN